MQSVPAAASDGVIKRDLQIVVAEKPIESRPRLTAPVAVTRDPVRFETCGNRAGGLNRLLIEARLFTTLVVKALRSDGHKEAAGFAMLCFHKPVERFEPGGNHAIVRAGRAHD